MFTTRTSSHPPITAKRIRQPVDMRCAGRNEASRVDQSVEGVKDFIVPEVQDGDLADAVAELGGKPGSFDLQEGGCEEIQCGH